jgi:hypothetical protein
MKKNQKIGLGITIILAIIIIAGSLIYSYERAEDIKGVPSSVTWGDDIENQISTVRQAEDFEEAKRNLEANNFPLQVLKAIPLQAKTLNLAWANKVKKRELTLFLFSAKDRLVLLDESKNDKFRAKLSGFEPGFVIRYNSNYHYYLLESFSKVLNNEELVLYPLDNYWQQEQAKEDKKKVDKVIRSVQFSDKFYPCSLYDNIDFWVDFAKERNIKLLGHFGLPSSKWKEVAYDKAQRHLETGYIIALDLSDNSSYIKLQSKKEYIQTANEKMAIKLP